MAVRLSPVSRETYRRRHPVPGRAVVSGCARPTCRAWRSTGPPPWCDLDASGRVQASAARVRVPADRRRSTLRRAVPEHDAEAARHSEREHRRRRPAIIPRRTSGTSLESTRFRHAHRLPCGGRPRWGRGGLHRGVWSPPPSVACLPDRREAALGAPVVCRGGW